MLEILCQPITKADIDKTKYIPKLEKAGNFLTFSRPHKFGKTQWQL